MHIVYGGSCAPENNNGDPLKLQEYAPVHDSKPCDALVETDLDHECSYPVNYTECDPHGEIFQQEWNVTPYQIFIQNTSQHAAWCYIYIDGVKDLGNHSLQAGESKTILGFTCEDGSVQEFLFTRPRLLNPLEYKKIKEEDFQDATEEERLEVGSIKAKFVRVERFETYTKMISDTSSGSSIREVLSSTIDGKNKLIAKQVSAGATSRGGRTLVAKPERSRSSLESEPTSKKSTIWHLDHSPSGSTEIRIRYAMRDKLEDMGVVPKIIESRGDQPKRKGELSSFDKAKRKKELLAELEALASDDSGDDDDDDDEVIEC